MIFRENIYTRPALYIHCKNSDQYYIDVIIVYFIGSLIPICLMSYVLHGELVMT